MPPEEQNGVEPSAVDEQGSAQRRARDARTRAAVEAYRRTLRNESSAGDGLDREPGGPGAFSAEEARLLAERPPHWQTKPR